MEFGTLITAMVTPFDEQLQIDWDRTGKLIDYLIETQRSDSLVVCGTTGESPTLSDDEKLALFDFTVKRAAGRCRVIAGTGSNNTAHAIHLSQAAERTGVDGLLLVTPYYNKPSQEGMYRHFKAIAESVSIPVILYNVPSRTGVNLSAETTVRLSAIPNIVATKDCAPLDQLTQVVANASPGFKLYSGDDSMTMPVMAIGGSGIISVASHVIGAKMKDMLDAYIQGDTARASALNAECIDVFQGLFNCPHPVPNPVPVKYALQLHDMPVGGVRLPLIEATDAERRFIEGLFFSK